MVDSIDNIPTLTNIVHIGDASMQNHFDAHEFNEHETDGEMKVETEKEAPSISMQEENQTSLPDDFTGDFAGDFSEAMQLDSRTPNLSSNDSLDINNIDLKEQINQVVNALLPEIESLLKEKLYKQFKI